MIATPKRAHRPLQRVVLIKRTEDTGFPVGWEYTWTYTLATRAQAVERAKRALRRDFPAEDVQCWGVQP